MHVFFVIQLTLLSRSMLMTYCILKLLIPLATVSSCDYICILFNSSDSRTVIMLLNVYVLVSSVVQLFKHLTFEFWQILLGQYCWTRRQVRLHEPVFSSSRFFLKQLVGRRQNKRNFNGDIFGVIRRLNINSKPTRQRFVVLWRKMYFAFKLVHWFSIAGAACTN